MRKLKLFFAASALFMGGITANAYQTPTADGIYYVYNSLSGKFMSRGSSWGTRAIVDDYGVPVKLLATGDNFYFKCTDNDLYLSDDTWMYTDGGEDRRKAIALVAVDGIEGTYTLTNTSTNQPVYVYMTDGGDKYCIAGNGIKDDNYTDDGQTQWQFLTQAEHDAILASKQLTSHIAIASAAGYTVDSEDAFSTLISDGFESLDVTSTYIGDDNLNGGNAGNWTVNGVRKLDQDWATYVGGGNGVTESFSAATSLTKELSGLKAGIYKVLMNGFFRQGNNGVCWANKTAGFLPSNAYLKAGNDAVALKAWATAATFDGNETYTPDNTTQAAAAFNNGDYVNEVYTYVGEDGELTLTIGIPSFISWAGWACFNNVQLTYYRDKSASAVPVTAIGLNENSVSLTTGDVFTLSASITPENADDPSVLWTSSDETVATVSSGIVTALKAGNATITAKANGGENIEATCTVTVADATAPSFYSTAIADATDYYIVNVATGKFLGGANSWGTQASLIEHGIPFTSKLNDGKYTLDSHTYNSETDHFLNGTYIDGVSTDLYIKALSNGKYSISTADGSQFVSAQAGTTVVANNAADANSSFAQWYFLSKKDRDRMLAAATAANPADATYYIKEANISRNLRVAYNTPGWTNISYGEDKNQDKANYNAQVWNGTVNVSQTIENIPNGTYTLNMQGFSSGTDVKLTANDVEVAILPQPGISKQADAAPHFAAKEYTNTLNVTVTNRTLTISLSGDCTDAKWLCYDNFELYMTSYTANTGLTANIDNSEIEAGSTATITAATNPATASFNAITYSSSDEAVATVDENGVVTGLSVGTATITVAATEMESFTETIEVTVNATAPTALALSPATIELDATTTTAELTVTPTPATANTSVTWASSDETVATVVNGVVTAVSTGIATITATSTVTPTVSATATVTVTFPETIVPATIVKNDGATRTIYTLGANLIKNGSFEYPDAYYGWTVGTGAKMTSSQFTVETDADSHYIQSVLHNGSNSAGSLRQAWPIEPGKKYLFGYKVKNVSGTQQDNNSWFRVSLCNANPTAGDGTIVAVYPSYNGNWSDYSVIIDNTSSSFTYVQAHFRWLGENGEHTAFDDFYLCEVPAEDITVGNVDYATAAIPTANIGTGAFQYSQDAIDAANALVQGEATVADVEAAYEALTTLNVPEASQAYNLVFNCEGHSATGNALTLIPNPSQTQGLYGLKYLAPANKNLAQAFYFTHTTGNKYKVYAIDTDGNERYITTQAEGYGTTWYEGIRTIDDATKAMEIEIRPNGKGLYLLWNIGANKPLAHNGNNNNDLFTNNTANFQFVETTKPSIIINTTAAGWGTTILPFAVTSLPDDVKAYTCTAKDAKDDTKLTLVKVDALAANTPYIIEGSWNATVTGDAQGTKLTYDDGWLTGVYEDTTAPVGSYVLQKNAAGVGFYQVAEGAQPTVGAYRCYLTVSDASRAFFLLGGEANAIEAIETLTSGEAEIYNAAGARVPGLQKGMNIIRKADGQSYKVMVK